MKNRGFDLLPNSMKSVEEDEFEFERVIKLVEEWGIKESARGLKLSEEKVIQNVLEYIKNVNPHIEYLQEMVDQESRWMVNEGERGSELQESPHLKASHAEGGDESVDVQETRTIRVVGNREIVLLGSTKLVEIIGHRENELEQMIKVVEMMGIKGAGRLIGLEDLEVINKVKEYIRLKRSRVEFLKKSVQESNVMTEKRKNIQESEFVRETVVCWTNEEMLGMNTDQEPHMGMVIEQEERVSGECIHVQESNETERESEFGQKLYLMTLDEEKEGGEFLHVEEISERENGSELGQNSHLKTLNEGKEGDELLHNESESGQELQLKLKTLNEEKKGGDESVHVQKTNEREKEQMIATNGGRSIVVMQMGGEEYERGSGSGNFQRHHQQKNTMMQVQQSVYDKEYPPLPGRLTSQQQQLNVKEINEKYEEPKSRRELHLKSLNEEKEEGDESVDRVEVRNKRQNELELGPKASNKEREKGDGFVHAEARNERGSEEVTRDGMSIIGREVGDSMQVLGRGHGRGGSRGQQLHRSMIGCSCGGSECKGWGRAHVVRLQHKVYTTEYPPLQGNSRGQHQQQPGVQGRGRARGLSRGQQPQSVVGSQDLPAPDSVHGGFASYINNALVAPNRQTKRRGGN